MIYEEPFGPEVDLDNPDTYKHLPDTLKELDDRFLKEIGYTQCYFKYFHPYWDKKQIKRVEILIKEYCENRRVWWDNIPLFKEKLYLFENEIENMC